MLNLKYQFYIDLRRIWLLQFWRIWVEIMNQSSQAYLDPQPQDVCTQFFAKDMHSGMRSKIENEILDKMKTNLEKQADGIKLIAVLMKSIQLPRGLSQLRKLQAEQDAMRMEFVLSQEKQEAERKIISAQGERDAQIIISEGLTEGIIRIKAIEAFKQLSKSNNAKVILTDGKTPLMVTSETD